MNEEFNNEVYNYQVNTIMPIIGLSCGNLMVPSTAKLTKDDVLICLKKAPVFRRFPNRKLERVTISNLDRLHNEKFMTEEEYEVFLEKQGDNRGKVAEASIIEAPVAEEQKKEAEPETVATPVVEEVPEIKEVKEETVTEDSIIEETEVAEEVTPVEDTIEDEVTDDINDEEVSEDVTNDTPDLVEEKETLEETNGENKPHNRYTNKKKHNR